MDRCQHGEKIDRFCASECCVWREGAGCSNTCMKKYHNHMGPSIIVSQKEVDILLKKYKVDNWVKPKVKTLEETIHNYFNCLRIQINNYIDEVDKKIRTQLCYPYLSKNGIIGVYKKLKKRQYRKVQQRQFRQFYEQTINLKPDDFAKEQKSLYEKELHSNRQIIYQLFSSFSVLQDSLKSISSGINFQVDKNYEQKIRLVFDSIPSFKVQNENDLKDEIKQKFQDLSVIQNKKIQLLKQQLQKPMVHKYSSSGNTGRKKSLDLTKTDETSSLYKEIDKKSARKSRQQLDQMKNDIVNLMSNSNKKQQLNTFDLVITAPSQQGRVKTVGSQTSSRQNFDTKSNKNYLAVDSKQMNFSSSIQSLALSDKLGSKIKQKSQKNEITDIKHHQLPSQAQNIPAQQDKQGKKGNDLRLIVVPFKADKPLEPSQLSPLLQKRKKFFATQNKKDDKKLDGFELLPVQEQSPIREDVVKTPQRPKKSIKPNTTLQQQKSIQLLTEAVQSKGDQAIPLLKQALKRAPNNLSAAQYLSFLLLQSNDFKQCLKVCNAIQDQLQDQMVYQSNLFHINNNKAVALLQLGRYSEAIVVLQKCLNSQQSALTYKNLGDAYYSIGIHQKAVYNYEKSISLKPSGQTYYNLAVCLYIQQNFHNSLIMAQLAVQQNSQAQQYTTLVKQIKSNM